MKNKKNNKINWAEECPYIIPEDESKKYQRLALAGLTPLALGGFWSVYAELDNRIRDNQLKEIEIYTRIETIREEVTEIRGDIKYIKEALWKRKEK
ncbi:MAG: hypothetical protein ACO2ZP_07350 [Bacteriovoracaceae bacterium]